MQVVDVFSYQKYTFKCYPDKAGYVMCEAQNVQYAANHVTFQLVKIN